MVRQLVSVFKLRIGVFITLSALAGLAVTPGPSLPWWQVAVLAAAVLVSAASAGAFNQYMEAEIDARMSRTRTRPFVTGEFGRGRVWLVVIWGLLAAAVGSAGLLLNLWVALHVFLGAFTYGVVYTVWLKPRSVWNIVIGGLAGSFAVLAGASAVDPGLGPVPLLLAVVLFLWTPPHFWSLATVLREDYAAAGVPMLPVVVGPQRAAWVIFANTLMLVGASILPAFFGLGPIYLVGAVLGGGWFAWTSWRLVREPTPKMAMVNFFASLVQLCALLGGAMLDARFGAGWPA